MKNPKKGGILQKKRHRGKSKSTQLKKQTNSYNRKYSPFKKKGNKSHKPDSY